MFWVIAYIVGGLITMRYVAGYVYHEEVRPGEPVDGEMLIFSMIFGFGLSMVWPAVVGVFFAYKGWIMLGDRQDFLVRILAPVPPSIETKTERHERENEEMREYIRQLEAEAGIEV